MVAAKRKRGFRGRRWNGTKRVPSILQFEAAECGLACLAMIACFHGRECTLQELRSRFSTGLNGSTARLLIALAKQLGLAGRAVRLELKALHQLALPAVVHVDRRHFAVLVDVQRRSVIINDPASGTRRLSMAEFSDRFTGVALELWPDAEFEKKAASGGLSLTRLFWSVHGLPSSLLVVAVFSLILNVVGLTPPLVLQLVVDRVLEAGTVNLLGVLVAGFVGVKLVELLVGAFRAWSVLFLTASLGLQVSGRLMKHMLSLPYSWFTSRSQGSVAASFSSMGSINASVTGEVIAAGMDGLFAVLTAAVLFSYSPILSFVCCSALAMAAVIKLASMPLMRSQIALGVDKRAACQTVFIETLRAIQPIRALGLEAQRLARWQSSQVDAVNADVRLAKLRILFGSSAGLVAVLEHAAILWFGATFVLAGEMSVGMFYAYLAWRALFVSRAMGLLDKVIAFRLLGVHTERVADIALSLPEDGAASRAEEDVLRGGLVAKGISFRYSESEPWVFQNLDLKVRAGEHVVVVSPSGTGKSTLLKVLSGLMPAREGRLELNGASLREFGLFNYRQQTATVMQNDELLSGTLAQNISCFADEVDAKGIRRAAKAAEASEFIERLPMGYQTSIGDMGSTLSGGQRQRILIARALYREPRILFLDEATSHLDADTEIRINKNLRELGITCISVAHREETIRAADRIVRLHAPPIPKCQSKLGCEAPPSSNPQAWPGGEVVA